MPFSRIALASLAALVVMAKVDLASARGDRASKHEAREMGPAVMAIVALGEQRVTAYDADGQSVRAPVSTGQTGYETPAGIFSVIGKEVEHTSNLYDDASMPFMQRLTWSGIALHAGVLPGYPASHGCVRMPHAFAERLFDMTKLGTRIVVVRNDIAPVEVSHRLLFKPMPLTSDVSLVALGGTGLAPPNVPLTLRAVAEAKSAAAEAAARKAEEARRAALQSRGDIARLARTIRMAEVAKRRAEAYLGVVEQALEVATEPEARRKAEAGKAEALRRLEEANATLEAANAEEASRKEAADVARQHAVAAEEARVAAVAEAKEAARKLRPVTVFISRSTQRLYVRQGFQPLFDSEVTIADADSPIGTYIFTALAFTNDDADIRWNALSMYATGHGASTPRRRSAEAAVTRTDAAAAARALDRISIPEEAVRRISEVVSPGSSLIISDEEMHKETSTGTDVIVLMSGEPQGGIKIRRRTPAPRFRYERPFYPRQPYGSSFWW